jgi:acyl carrier protein
MGNQMDNQTLEDITKSIQTFVYRKFPRARKHTAGLDDKLLENRLIDSLGLLDIITFIETQYAVTIDDDAVTTDHFGTMNNIARFVHHLISE